MLKFNRAMVALDLSSTDEHLLRYSEFLTKIFQTETVYFVHIIPDMMKPENVDVEFHKLFSPTYPIDEKVKNKLSGDIKDVFGESTDLKWQVEVLEGKPYEKLIHWVDVKATDLLVVGHKRRSESSGITARRVARKSKASVLFVPPNASNQIKQILVPIDFSAHSYRALNKALIIREALDFEVEIIALNVVSRPAIDYYSRSWESPELKTALIAKAQREFQEFIVKYELPEKALKPVFLDNLTSAKSKILQEYLAENPTDLVVMGAKGHSPFETFMYGSVTEAFVEQYRRSPVLVVR